MEDFLIHVDRPTVPVHCNKCNEKVNTSQIRVESRPNASRKYSHLSCFEPNAKKYIKPSELSVKLPPDLESEFFKWLKEWNSNFTPLDRTMAVSVKKTLTMTQKLERDWCLMECLKFLSLEDLLPIKQVCGNFYEILWSDQFWKCLIQRDFDLFVEENVFERYSNLYLNSCYGCYGQERSRCPILKLPLCQNCKLKPEFQLLNKTKIKKHTGIKPESLELKFYKTKNQVLAYRFMVDKAVLKYREGNKQHVLKVLETKGDLELRQKVDSINVSGMRQDFCDENLQKAYHYIRNRSGGYFS